MFKTFTGLNSSSPFFLKLNQIGLYPRGRSATCIWETGRGPCEDFIREHLTGEKSISFGHCPDYLPPLPPIRASCTTFLDVKNDVLTRITETINDDYDND